MHFKFQINGIPYFLELLMSNVSPHPSLKSMSKLFSRLSSRLQDDGAVPSLRRSKRSGRNRFKHAMQFELLEKRLVMADPDDAISEAFMLGAISTTPISVSAAISPDTDVNMVGFTVTAGQVVDFDIDTPLNGPGGLGAYLRLFNAQGTQIAFNNDGMAPGEDTLGFDPYLRYTFATGGSYFLGTSNYNNLQYNAVTGDGDTAGGLYSTGNYTLIIKALPIDLDDSIAEAASLGAISATAKTIRSEEHTSELQSL